MNTIKGTGLRFQSLYWTHHDSWIYRRSVFPNDMYHWGHVHFFLLGYKWNILNADAFSGSQTYKFDIKDLWGPRSNDPNQSLPYRVIGTPKWYWRIEEVWRRIYIQKWDERVQIENPEIILGRRGIRWDACSLDHMYGPFREGNRFSPMFLFNARTLPVEYFNTVNKLQTERDNYVMDRAQSGIATWNGTAIGEELPQAFDPDKYGLDHGTSVSGGPRATASFPDGLYIGPTIEYQKVVQLDWERMPGWALLHDHDESSFGDGWSNTVRIPFVNPVTGKYNSPFGPQPGVVHPFGEYFGQKQNGNPLVPFSNRPVYRSRDDGPPGESSDGGYDYINRPFDLAAFKDDDPAWTGYREGVPLPHDAREDLAGKPVRFQNPYGSLADGKWVQQCIGGIIQCKAEVVLEHKLGGRTTQWVTATQLIPAGSFAGTDQAPKP